MFRNIVYSACCASALLSGIAMVEDVRGMDKVVPMASRSSTVDRWTHIVPDGEIKTKINELLPFVVEDRKKMEELVELLCHNGSPYGNYAHMRYVDTFFDNHFASTAEECQKYERMLSTIAVGQCGGGKVSSSVYWKEYDKEYYNSYMSSEEDAEESDE